MKVLMVCLGNICRSPIAHGLLQHKIETLGLDWSVDSAGTGAYHVGELADFRSRAIMKSHGIDIDYQRARQFNRKDFRDFDIIYAMDKSNYQNIVAIAANDFERSQVKMVLNESYPNENREVPDPYYGGDDGFISLYKMLDTVTDAIIENNKSDNV